MAYRTRPGVSEEFVSTTENQSLVVVGGCGHVGLPLALAFADAGMNVVAYDINSTVVDLVNSGQMPFDEPDGPEYLGRGVASGRFRASADPSTIEKSDVVIVVIGTPVDEHLNPDPEAVPRAIESFSSRLRKGQLLVLRSTVYPGVTRLVERRLENAGIDVDIAFCPERIAEGKAFTELFDLPQIVSGCSNRAIERSEQLFRRIANDIVVTTPEEAELAKLFTNTWRYIKFAAANQFYTIANDFGVDFERVRHAITFKYPRAADMPGPGFAAGPCLFKDTMQLAAFNNNNFMLGHASMMVNEGLPLYMVSRLEERFDLANTTVGILGMSFKANSDDTRSSLAYKLRRILAFRARKVLCSDYMVRNDSRLIDEGVLLNESDVVIIGAPHSRYKELKIDKPVIDVWNLRGEGVLI